ncbi:Hint domain-containing protein [Gimesia maris]|uniref:Hint domain-containing protein n=1 Tax=Gimesia maris TaxID=122 RepID=UPI0012B95826|nr:Hint domain-containing protein [Gimesia maris]
MSDISRKLLILSCFLFTSFCFWQAGTGLIGGVDAKMLPSAQAAMSPPVTPPRVVTTPIQQMRPGMQIIGRNPLRIQTESTIDPTPAGWRLVLVRMRKEDGTYFEAELLRPLSWLRLHQAQPGAVIMLNMPELHVVGAAEVLSISACPPIDPGDGPVVISTFKNTADNILNIYVEGETEPIGVTAGHPIWSEDRQAFIHSDQLQPGERLRSAVGKAVRITSIEIRAGPEPVYNLEVVGEHVYSVTNSGLLVHNIGCEDLSTTIDVYSSNHLVSQFDTINAPRSKQWGPAHGAGPLGEDVTKTFRGGSYVETKLSEPVTLYRVYGGKAGKLGPYWTRTKPTGPLQSRLDSALLSEWGNTARNVTTIQVPRGTTVFEGFAAPQVGKAKPFETIIGGGNQVYIPRVNPDWVMR